MVRELAGVAISILAIDFLAAGSVQIQPASIEIAFVANAEAGTVTLVEVESRAVVGTIDVNPAHEKGEGPGATNYAQDTDVSPDGKTLYVSRGTSVMSWRSTSRALSSCGGGVWTLRAPTT